MSIHPSLCQFVPAGSGYICSRCETQRPKLVKRKCCKPPLLPVRLGPGTYFARIVARLGIEKPSGCKCDKLAAAMNRLGADGCREQRQSILAEIKKNKTSRWEKIKAAALVVGHGMTFIDPRDPIGSIYDEAVRLAED